MPRQFLSQLNLEPVVSLRESGLIHPRRGHDQRVFAAITDYERYPEFLPDMKNVRVTSRHDGVAVATFELEIINVSVSYSGATPDEVSESLLQAMESAVQDVEGIEEITATAEERVMSN